MVGGLLEPAELAAAVMPLQMLLLPLLLALRIPEAVVVAVLIKIVLLVETAHKAVPVSSSSKSHRHTMPHSHLA